MGRPKGSKNKVKNPLAVNETMRPIILAGSVPIDAIVMKPRPTREPKPVAIAEPESVAKKRADLLAAMRAPLSPAETRQLLAEAQSESAKVRDPQLVVNDAVAQVIKPNWNNAINQDGCKHFYIKSQRNGESVSFEVEKWQRALQEHRLPSGNITFKIEGMGMEPGGGTGAPMWRVMIG